MKRFILFFLLLFSCTLIFSQTNISVETRFFLNDLRTCNPQYKKGSLPDSGFFKKYPVYRVGIKNYISFVALVDEKFDPVELSKYSIIVGSRTGNIITLRIPLENVDIIDKIKGLKYLIKQQKTQKLTVFGVE